MTADVVNHPAHYQGASEFAKPVLRIIVPEHLLEGECIDAIECLNLGFHLGNAIKYLWRCGLKGDATTDLEKAKWYLKRVQKSPQNRGRQKEAMRMIEMIERLLNNPNR